jgi:hypothetical protein
MTNDPLIAAPPVRSPAVGTTLLSLVGSVRRSPGLLALIALYAVAAASARTPFTVAVAILMVAVFALRVRCRTRGTGATELAANRADPTPR